MTSPLIQVKQIKKYFLFKKQILRAVDNISFNIFPKETLGLVGESGCGKTTLARSLIRLYQPTSGDVLFKQQSILNLRGKPLKSLRREMQYIFQDPYTCLNPRMTAGEIIAEPLKIHKILNRFDRKKRVEKLLNLVELSPKSMRCFPHEFSGGQRQRIGIARALALNPSFIICDEPIAALDASIQAQVINLLRNLQQEIGLTYLFISHDLKMVKYVSTRIAVMYLGHLMELSPSDNLYEKPLHPYTQALLSTIPKSNTGKKQTHIALKGEIPSPIHPPKGCIFSTRCPMAKKICFEKRPSLREVVPNRQVACHLVS